MPRHSETGAVETARRLVARHRRAAAFTGAGVSTASGVPDFRSPGGIWSRHRPVPFDEFLADPDARRRYWAYKRETYDDFARAQPNAAHRALADMETAGHLLGVITQNIDGLHQAAGSGNVLELHGTNRWVACLRCAARHRAAEIQARLVAGCDVPTCDACGGWLKPATVSFGQSLPAAVVDAAFALATSAELLFVMGSSLLVYPAADIPRAAAEAGARLVLINRDPTPLDGVADVVLHGPIEELLPAIVGPGPAETAKEADG